MSGGHERRVWNIEEEVRVAYLCNGMQRIGSHPVIGRTRANTGQKVPSDQNPPCYRPRWIEHNVRVLFEKVRDHIAILFPVEVAVRQDLVGGLPVGVQFIEVGNHVGKVAADGDSNPKQASE